jgi:hypothetical protein
VTGDQPQSLMVQHHRSQNNLAGRNELNMVVER